LALRLLRSKIRDKFYREQWAMAYRLDPAREESDVPDGVFYRFRELQPPKDRFWADPFPVHAGGSHWLFFEEYLYSEPYAHLCVAEITSEGMQAPRIALKRPYHLSYPAVFEWEGEWY